jgi:adenylyltransferase/sulfurtransferase
MNRQFLYAPADIGQSKAALAAERIRGAHPQIEVTPVVDEIDARTALTLVDRADIVLDCLDNLQSRVALGRACVKQHTPLVHAAVAELTGYLSVFDPPQTPCLECFQTSKPPSVEPAIPGFSSGVMGSLQAMEAVKYLLGIGTSLLGRVLIFEGAVPSMDVVTFERDPECPVCREAA